MFGLSLNFGFRVFRSSAVLCFGGVGFICVPGSAPICSIVKGFIV